MGVALHPHLWVWVGVEGKGVAHVDGVLSGALACWFQAMVIPERVNMCVCE